MVTAADSVDAAHPNAHLTWFPFRWTPTLVDIATLQEASTIPGQAEHGGDGMSSGGSSGFNYISRLTSETVSGFASSSATPVSSGTAAAAESTSSLSQFTNGLVDTTPSAGNAGLQQHRLLVATDVMNKHQNYPHSIQLTLSKTSLKAVAGAPLHTPLLSSQHRYTHHTTMASTRLPLTFLSTLLAATSHNRVLYNLKQKIGCLNSEKWKLTWHQIFKNGSSHQISE